MSLLPDTFRPYLRQADLNSFTVRVDGVEEGDDGDGDGRCEMGGVRWEGVRWVGGDGGGREMGKKESWGQTSE